jgi:hypothetical protein
LSFNALLHGRVSGFLGTFHGRVNWARTSARLAAPRRLPFLPTPLSRIHRISRISKRLAWSLTIKNSVAYLLIKNFRVKAKHPSRALVVQPPFLGAGISTFPQTLSKVTVLDMSNSIQASFRTSALFQCLNGVLSSIEKLAGEQPPDSKTTEFIEQIKDLLAITSSLDDTATSTRRQPFHHQTLLEGDNIHLQRLVSTVTTTVEECIESIGILQSALLDLITEKTSNPYFPAKVALGNQDWFEECLSTMRLQTEALQLLLSAITLVYQKNDLDEDGYVPSEARLLASTLQYQLAHLNQKWQTASPQFRKWVRAYSEYSNRC